MPIIAPPLLATSSSSGGPASLVFLVLMIGVLYFLMIRPGQRRMRAQRSMQSSLGLGDEVVTAGGFLGFIRRFDGDLVTIEIAPGVEARVRKGAIVGKAQPEVGAADDAGRGELDER